MQTERHSRGLAPLVLAALAAVAALAGGLGYLAGSHRGHAPAPAVAAAGSAAPSAPIAAAVGPATDASGRRILYWHDPMVPAVKFDKPGKSPYMDMMLVPVYADGVDDGAVSISPRIAQSFGVRLVEARTGRLDSAFSAVGTIAVDERAITGVQSRVQGFVERLHVRATYDPVRAGDPVADLFVPEWVAAQEELLALKVSAHPGAAALVDAARHRLRLLGMPDAEVARVEREGRSSGRVAVYAPAGGVVWEIGARDGMAVMPGTNLVRIASLASVWLIAEVPETQAGLLAPGAAVEARVAALPDRVFRGRVQALLPEVNAAARTVRARVELANPGGALKPGMYASVALRDGAAREGVVVPSEAVIRTGTRSVVIVADGTGRYTPVDVEAGREAGDLTEIRKGLAAGQSVVASGQFLIDSEANLKTALARLEVGDQAATSDGGGHAGHGSHAGQTAPAAATVHKASGVVRTVAADEVFIQHGAIPTAGMGAMTMGFKAPKSGVPSSVKAGARVDFEFTITSAGEFALKSIAPAAPK